ncbi:hypothetical protein ABZ552_05575 [Nocardia sp. NPDC019219]|uniref:hypothetical protein n=1 Tax=Nocardia sp. NPDC019219 TaxID=3154590 RepID=UPI00341077A8
MRDSNIPVANHFGIECVRVRVTNIGRAAVSVENIALDVGQTKWWRRGRKTFVPWLFHAKDDDREAAVTQPSVRLEAGATVSQVFHLWPGARAQAQKLKHGRTLTIRGTATAAGRRPTLSPRRFAWKFNRGDESWFTDYVVTPEMRVYRSLWQSSYAEYVGGLPLLLHREISKSLREGATSKDIEEYLKEHRSEGIFGMAAFDAHKAFHGGDDSVGNPVLEPDSVAEIDAEAEPQST